MSVKTQTCFTVICDDCKAIHEHDYEPHWPCAGDAIDDAVNSGEWWGDEKLLLCFTCRYKPHAFLPGEFSAEDCARCDNPEDEHAPSPCATCGLKTWDAPDLEPGDFVCTCGRPFDPDTEPTPGGVR